MLLCFHGSFQASLKGLGGFWGASRPKTYPNMLYIQENYNKTTRAQHAGLMMISKNFSTVEDFLKMRKLKNRIGLANNQTFE